MSNLLPGDTRAVVPNPNPAPLPKVRVVDDFIAPPAIRALLHQLGDNGLHSARAQLANQPELSGLTLDFWIPAPLEQRVRRALSGSCRRASAGLDEWLQRVPGQVGGGSDVDWHRDVSRHGELIDEEVGVLYLAGEGTLVIADPETAHETRMEVLPGRLISWCNRSLVHKLEARPGAPRVMLGPMTVDAAQTALCRGGSPCASPGDLGMARPQQPNEIRSVWNGRPVVVKCFPDATVVVKCRDFDAELAALSAIKHPNVARLLRYTAPEDTEGEKARYLVLDLPTTDLGSALPQMNWAERTLVLLGAWRGLKATHDARFLRVSRVGSSDVRIHADGTGVLANFGLASPIPEGEDVVNFVETFADVWMLPDQLDA
eukprot:TRINITY_DN5570_c0_g1_i1.p1 TRINITY_DN5570_c0_g1~~TRINITY_DN5570_c0_g1_i1.p1  ORF type:complete len:374 (+),score=51.48 TRINITY_DN5570_c0_g1_i1:218-1339(+)